MNEKFTFLDEKATCYSYTYTVSFKGTWCSEKKRKTYN